MGGGKSRGVKEFINKSRRKKRNRLETIHKHPRFSLRGDFERGGEEEIPPREAGKDL